MRYTAEQLELIAHAIRNLWSSCYQGTILPGMKKGIGQTGAKAYADLLNADRVQIFGGEGTNLDLQAIIAMGQDGLEEAIRIRDGYAPFDMKPGFLNSRYAKIYKGGENAGKKYFVMGFRHTTPGSSGRTGTPMSQDVYRRAKKSDKFIEQKSETGIGRVTKKASLINISATKESKPMPEDYTWRNGILAGMTRSTQSGEGKRHSGFRTFRVITPNSPAASWWHPGQDPNDVIGAVVKYVEPHIKSGLEQAAKKDVIAMIEQAFNR